MGKFMNILKWVIVSIICLSGVLVLGTVQSCSSPKSVLRLNADEIIIEDFPFGTNTHYIKSDGKVYRIWGVARNKQDSIYYVKSHLNYAQYDKEKIYYVPNYSE